VSDPRKDAATENQVCIRKQNRGENRRPDTSMRSVWCWRKAGASSARSEKGCGQENQICAQPKGGNSERPDTMVRSVVWQREKWVASDPRKVCGQENQICTRQQNLPRMRGLPRRSLRAIRERMRPRIIKLVDNQRGAKTERPQMSMRSV
jgi:hypothetical protein